MTSTRYAVHSIYGSGWILNIGVPFGFYLIFFQNKLIDKIHVRFRQERAFALPGAKRSVVTAAGSLPRLARTVGRSRATEPTLTVKGITATEARGWGLINAVPEDAGLTARCWSVRLSTLRWHMRRASSITSSISTSWQSSARGFGVGQFD